MRRKILNIVLIVSLMVPAMPVHATEVQEELASVVEEQVTEEIAEETTEESEEEIVEEVVAEVEGETAEETVEENAEEDAEETVEETTEETIEETVEEVAEEIVAETTEEVIQETVEEHVLETIIESDEIVTAANNVAINASNFPDANFREYIKSNVDKDSDGVLSATEISNCSILLPSWSEITSLKGVEIFTNLTYLDCSRNALTELDVSKLIKLTTFNCGYNSITKLDVSKLSELVFFQCYNNELTELDVGKLKNLIYLDCANNNIDNLDISKCTKIVRLECSNNRISKLNVDNCTELADLRCYDNEISELQVGNCTNLQELQCNNNEISQLDVSKCTELRSLECNYNNLRSLEISGQSEIKNMATYSYVRSNTKQFDFSKYSSFNPGKVKILNGLTLNGKVFTLTEDSFGSGAYEYDCGNGNVLVVNLRYVKEPEAFVSKKEFPQEIRIDKLPENVHLGFWNQGHNDYYSSYATSVINSYLTINEDNTYTRVSSPLSLKDYVYLEKYSSDFQLLSSGRIKKELPEFGGFYDDGKYYYLVFGQNNPNEDDGTEVFRVVKYSHNWTRLDAASIYGVHTIKPFKSGSLRFDTYDGYLFIRTCHQMYTHQDGLNHQANFSMKIRIADMGVSDTGYYGRNEVGYVSHSFNQFVKSDNGTVYTLDQGDAYPRAAILYKWEADKSFNQSERESVNTLSYSDYADIHYNYTFATLGGLEVSDYAIITAGSSAPQDGVNKYYNIYITTTDKKNFSSEGTKLKWITNYTNGNTQVGNPYLVEINKNKYMLMWTEKDAGTYEGNLQLKYVLLDGKGNMVGNVITRQGVLSDCQPIYDSKTNQIIWYVVNNKGETSFYTIGAWPFTDVAVKPGNWKYEAVKYVYDNKIMNGVGDGTRFDPDAPLTREMFATVLYRMAGEPAVTYKRKFPDVPGGKWYSNAVIWASEQGIVSGYGSGNFGTGHYITREQISKMLMEYGDKQGYDVSQSANFNSFADAGKVSGWAKDYMKWAVGSGMIGGSQKNGKYYLNPQGNATRAECATMLKRFMEKY